jgi:putative phage-type endonuclease
MKRVTLNQGSEQWKAWRREGIGGSDIAAILGLSPYDDHTREVVFREKVHRIEREGNFAMHRGQRLEPHARYAYERRQRCSAPPACVEADGTPWARVSLDGLCHDGAAINAAYAVVQYVFSVESAMDRFAKFALILETKSSKVSWSASSTSLFSQRGPIRDIEIYFMVRFFYLLTLDTMKKIISDYVSFLFLIHKDTVLMNMDIADVAAVIWFLRFCVFCVRFVIRR